MFGAMQTKGERVKARLSAQSVVLSIAAIERDTGLSKDTLRVWERRYGFPVAMRDSQGERSYPLDQLQRLRTLKRLIDGRHRPGRVVCLDAGELERLLRAIGVQATGAKHGGRAGDGPGTRRPEGVHMMPPLASINVALAEWRARRHDTP